MNLREAAEKALEALEWINEYGSDEHGPSTFGAEHVLREALAEPERKPWIGLTTDEVLDCAKDFEGRLPEGWMKIVESVNTRLREKNT
jgi:hypothetical protein